MPASSDPEKRARQLANLRKPGDTIHGARSEAKVRPLRERFLAELHQAFPAVPLADLNSQAERQALISLYSDYVDERGPIRHRRRGELFPAAQELARLLTAYEKRNTELRALQSQHDATPADDLASIVAELTAGDEDG